MSTAADVLAIAVPMRGVDDKCRVVNPPDASLNLVSFTIQLWVRVSASISSTQNVYYFSQGSSSSSSTGRGGNSLRFGTDGSDRVRFSFGDGDDTATSSSVETRGLWRHWTASFDNTTLTKMIYCNGSALDVTQSEPRRSLHQVGGPLFLGSKYGNGTDGRLIGGLDEVRVFISLLDASQVSQLWNAQMLYVYSTPCPVVSITFSDEAALGFSYTKTANHAEVYTPGSELVAGEGTGIVSSSLSTSAGAMCLECPRGHFKIHDDDRACEECSAGTYQTLPFSTACHDCPAGSFRDPPGESRDSLSSIMQHEEYACTSCPAPAVAIGLQGGQQLNSGACQCPKGLGVGKSAAFTTPSSLTVPVNSSSGFPGLVCGDKPDFTLEFWHMRTKGKYIAPLKGNVATTPLLYFAQLNPNNGIFNINDYAQSIRWSQTVNKQQEIIRYTFQVFNVPKFKNTKYKGFQENTPLDVEIDSGLRSVLETTWTHWALRFDNSSLLRTVFKDGVEVRNVALEAVDGVPLNGCGGALFVGSRTFVSSTGHPVGAPIAGEHVRLLDELRIWQAARSDQAILVNFQKQVLVADALVVSLTFDDLSDLGADSSGLGNRATVVVGVGSHDGAGCFIACGAAPNGAYMDTLTGECSSCPANTHTTGTLSGISDCLCNAGWFGGGAAFQDSSMQALTISAPFQNSFTIEFWMMAVGSSNVSVITQGESGPDTNIVTFGFADGSPRLSFGGASTLNTATSDSVTLPKSQWAHWAISFDAGTKSVAMFLDTVDVGGSIAYSEITYSNGGGKQIDTIAARLNMHILPQPSGVILIGQSLAHANSSWPGLQPQEAPLTGFLDELRVWKRVRSQFDLKDHWKSALDIASAPGFFAAVLAISLTFDSQSTDGYMSQPTNEIFSAVDVSASQPWSCMSCPAGTSKAIAGSQQCSQCSSGMFLASAVSCLSCPDSGLHVGPAGITSSAECECAIGYSAANVSGVGVGDTCLPCRAGSYKDVLSAEASCLPCDPGTFTAEAGQSDCSQCDAGTFNSLAGRKYSCMSCPRSASGLLQGVGLTEGSQCKCGAGSSGLASLSFSTGGISNISIKVVSFSAFPMANQQQFRTMANAQMRCDGKGGLAIIRTAFENDLAASACFTIAGDDGRCLIGLVRDNSLPKLNNRDWRWSDGSPIGITTFWWGSEPNNHDFDKNGIGESFVELRLRPDLLNFGWYDIGAVSTSGHVLCGSGFSGLSGTDFSVEFWSRQNRAGHTEVLLSQGAVANTLERFQLRFTAGLFSMDFGMDYAVVTVSEASTVGTWVHRAVVFKSTSSFERKIFENGILAQRAEDEDQSGATLSLAGHMVLGKSSSSDGDENAFEGSMDELRIWVSVRSDQAILENFQKQILVADNLMVSLSFDDLSNPGADSSGFGHDATAVSGFGSDHGAVCLSCAKGKFKSEVEEKRFSCDSCPDFSSSSPASTTSDDCSCNVGFEGINTACEACIPGKYKVASGAQACLDCPASQFQPEHSQGLCLDCPVNSASPPGTIWRSNCSCLAGFYLVPGASTDFTCAVCPGGTFKKDSGNALICANCSASSYRPPVAEHLPSMDCVACPVDGVSVIEGAASVSSGCMCGQGKRTGNSAGFDGLTGTRLVLSAGQQLNDCMAAAFTIQFWIQRRAVTNGERIFSKCSANATKCLNIGLDLDPAGKHKMSVATSGADFGPTKMQSSRASDGADFGVWVHWTFTWSAPIAKIRRKDTAEKAMFRSLPSGAVIQVASLVDGQSLAQQGIIEPGSPQAIVGSNFAGFVDELRVWEISLTSTQISNTMRESLSGSTNLVLSLTFDDRANLLEDSSGKNNNAIDAINVILKPGAACHPCAAGTFKWSPLAMESSDMPKSCDTCPAGKVGPVPVCETGDICDGLAVCEDCLADTYLADTGGTEQAVCNDCPVLTSTASPGAVALDACHCSPSSEYIGPNGGPCTAVNLCSDNDCDPVKASCNQTSPSSHTCTCFQGTFGNGTVCHDCPENARTAGVGAALSTDCTCRRGYEGLVDGGPCSACEEGKFKAVAGSAPCERCTPGQYGPDIVPRVSCLPCQANSISGFGATICVCAVGYSGPDGLACTECTAGTYKASNGSVACSDCAIGKYRRMPDATGSGESDPPRECRACPEHTTTEYPKTPSRDSCVCDIGFTGIGFANSSGYLNCSLCHAGTYKSHLGPATCLICPYGQYRNNAHDGSRCVICPDGFFLSSDRAHCLQHVDAPVVLKKNADGTEAIRSSSLIRSAGLTPLLLYTESEEGWGRKSFFDANVNISLYAMDQLYSCVSLQWISASCVLCVVDGAPLARNGSTSVLLRIDRFSSEPNGVLTTTVTLRVETFCLAGYYKDPAVGDCLECKVGTYQSKEDQHVCVSCVTVGPGMTTLALASTADSACVCDHDKVPLPVAGSGCGCAAGMFNDAGVCKLCRSNTYSEALNVAACMPCPDRMESQEGASSALLGCSCVSTVLQRIFPPGHGTTPGGPSAAVAEQPGQCVCPSGTFTKGIGLKVTCILCAKGEYQDATDQIKCSLCPLGRSTRATGTTDVIGCTCLGNRIPSISKSETSGPGGRCVCPPGTYANAGEVMASCKRCASGQYQPDPDSSACILCPTSASTLGPGRTHLSNCSCETNTYDVSLYPLAQNGASSNQSQPQGKGAVATTIEKACRPCGELPGAVCPGVATGGRLHTQAEFWRISLAHTQFIKCPNPLACRGSELCNSTNCPLRSRSSLTAGPGGSTLLGTVDNSTIDQQLMMQQIAPDDDKCREGHTGIVCFNCKEGYGSLQGGLCTPCPESTVLGALYSVGIILLVALYLLLLLYAAQHPERRHSIPLRLGIDHMQNLALLASVRMSWSSATAWMFSICSLSQLGLSALNVACTVRLTAVEELLAVVVSPFVLLISMAGLVLMKRCFFQRTCCCWGCRLKQPRVHLRFRKLEEMVQLFLVILFVVHGSVCHNSLAFFNCVSVGAGKRYLRSDYSTDCDDQQNYTPYLPVAFIGASFASVLIPGGLSLSLYFAKKWYGEEFLAAPSGRGYNLAGFFFAHLRRNGFSLYWECFRMMRKVALISVIVFVDTLMLQTTLSLLGLCISLCLLMHLRPYRDRMWGLTEAASLFTIFSTIVLGQMDHYSANSAAVAAAGSAGGADQLAPADDDAEQADLISAPSVLILAMNGCVILYLFIQYCWQNALNFKRRPKARRNWKSAKNHMSNAFKFQAMGAGAAGNGRRGTAMSGVGMAGVTGSSRHGTAEGGTAAAGVSASASSDPHAISEDEGSELLINPITGDAMHAVSSHGYKMRTRSGGAGLRRNMDAAKQEHEMAQMAAQAALQHSAAEEDDDPHALTQGDSESEESMDSYESDELPMLPVCAVPSSPQLGGSASLGLNTVSEVEMMDLSRAPRLGLGRDPSGPTTGTAAAASAAALIPPAISDEESGDERPTLVKTQAPATVVTL